MNKTSLTHKHKGRGFQFLQYFELLFSLAMQYLQVSFAFCNSKWLCVRKYIPVKYHGITTCNHILKLKCTISFFMWCIKLHTSAFATRRGNSMMVSYFLTPQVFQNHLHPILLLLLLFLKEMYIWIEGFKVFYSVVICFPRFWLYGTTRD